MEQGLYGYGWYHSSTLRAESINILNGRAFDGAFVVRKSDKDPKKPFTLDVWFERNVFHIQLRLRDDNNFAMGAYKDDEQVSNDGVMMLV